MRLSAVSPRSSRGSTPTFSMEDRLGVALHRLDARVELPFVDRRGREGHAHAEQQRRPLEEREIVGAAARASSAPTRSIAFARRAATRATARRTGEARKCGILSSARTMRAKASSRRSKSSRDTPASCPARARRSGRIQAARHRLPAAAAPPGGCTGFRELRAALDQLEVGVARRVVLEELAVSALQVGRPRACSGAWTSSAKNWMLRSGYTIGIPGLVVTASERTVAARCGARARTRHYRARATDQQSRRRPHHEDRRHLQQAERPHHRVLRPVDAGCRCAW